MATASQQATMEAIFEKINQHLGNELLWTLLATIGAVFSFRLIQSNQRRSRLIASLSSDTQRYFSIPARRWSDIKVHLLYAPMLGSRHSLSWTLGQLPTRLQPLFLTTVIAANAVLCFWGVPYRDPEVEVLAVLRSRTGTIALTNLIPIIIMASVKNLLIHLLNISFESFNSMHRWFGRIAIIEAALHATYHITTVVRRGDWASFANSISDTIIWTGLVALLAFAIILMQSPSIIRHAFYEAFLHIHILLAIIVLVFLWMHLDGFPQQRLVLACIVVWAASRLFRLSTLLYRSIGRISCTAVIEALPHDSVRVTITTPHPWTYKAGQYVYITIPSVGLWTAHPFSVAWSDPPGPVLSRQSSLSSQVTTNHDLEKAVEPTSQRTFSFVVRARDGFTKRLLAHTTKHAPAHLGHRVPVRALIERPYGLSRKLDSYGTVLLIAGGVGITHHLGYIRYLIQGYSEGTVATRKMTLIWVVRREADKECVGKWMNEILNMEGRKEVFRLELWVTRGTVSESRSPSNSVVVRKGRPNLPEIARREGDRRLGCMGVSVCGPGGLQDDARKVVRQIIKEGRNVEFVEQAFGW